MRGRATTIEQVKDVRERIARGERHKDIVAATGLPSNTISRIKNGWTPTGKRAIKLSPSVARQRGER